MITYQCSLCGKDLPASLEVFRCKCGGMMTLKEGITPFRQNQIQKQCWSLFRYVKMIPMIRNTWLQATMGEGMTPLIQPDSDNPALWAKMDYMMPTLSFKDRGAAVLLSYAKELGAKHIIQDSSGNAGCSIAAYASRAGMTCDIYVPDSTSEPKIRQIRAYGAQVHLVPGTRENTARAALEAVEESGAFYASHVYQPMFYQGTKTYVLELYEQLGGKLPDTLVVPVGNGTLLLGVSAGLWDLKAGGVIESFPRLVMVQAQGCAPIHSAFSAGHAVPVAATNQGTIAEGIAIAEPKRGREIISILNRMKGEVVVVTDEEIVRARQELAGKGIDVEPTGAVSYAAYRGAVFTGRAAEWGSVAVPFCGSGLKK